MKNLNKIILVSGAVSFLLVGSIYGETKEDTSREALEIEGEAQIEAGEEAEVESEADIQIEAEERDDSQRQEADPGEDYNSSRSNKPSTEADLEGESEVDEDYNTPRSNRSQADDDSDGDGIDDGEDDEPGENMRLMQRATNEDGKVYSWGSGLNVAYRNVEENEGSETALQTLSRLRVNGEEVRGWSDEEKQSLRSFVNENENSNSSDVRAAKIAQMSMENEKIGSIDLDEERAEVSYRSRMKLFGFIPVERDVRATMSNQGEVEVNYPWYSFLTSRPDDENMRETLSAIFSLNAEGSGEESEE